MVRITGVHKCQPKMHSQVINGFSFTGAFCAFCAFSASYQLSATYDFFPQCFRRWFLGCCGWRAKHLSRSLWSFTRREVVELNMFGWRYSCYSCCLFDFVCWLCNKMFRFSSWWDWKNSSSHCFEAGVNMSAFSVFRAEQLLRELSDQGFDDARHLLSDLAGTRSELWKKGGFWAMRGAGVGRKMNH